MSFKAEVIVRLSGGDIGPVTGQDRTGREPALLVGTRPIKHHFRHLGPIFVHGNVNLFS